MAGKNVITLADLFDFSDNTDFERAIQSIQQMEKLYKKLVRTLEQSNGKANKATKGLTNTIRALDKQLKSLDVSTAQGQKSLAAAAAAVDKKAASYKHLQAEMAKNEATIAKLREQVQTLTAAKNTLSAATRKTAQDENTASKNSKIAAGSYLDLKDKLKQAEAAYKALGAEASTAVKQEALKRVQQLSAHVKAADGALRTARTGIAAAAGSYHALRTEVNELNAKLRNMPDAFGKNRREVQLLQKAVYEKTQQLKNFDAAVNQNFRNVGNYTGGLTKMRAGVMSVIGAYSGFFAVQRGLSFVMSTQQAFEKSMSTLKSITKATAEDVAFYSDEARRMGATTTKTAAEVVEAFTQIGSKKADLLQNKEALSEVTEAALTLSEAAGVSVPEAANALTSALNQFELPASDSVRIINSLAAGAVAGAAEIPDLAASLDKFGATAKGANVTLEESVALTELMSEKNLVGAEAGTQLRNILLKLQAANIGYVDGQFNLAAALDEVAAKELDAKEAKKLFGLENINAARHIVNSRDKLVELTAAVTGTNEAYEAAAINTDNLTGDLDSLSSAIEGAVLEQDGFNKMMRQGVQGMIAFVKAVRAAPDFIEQNWGLVVMLTGALVIYNKAVIASTLATLKEVAVKKISAVTNLGLAGTWRALTAAMMANPFVLVAGLVIMLVGYLVQLYRTSEKVRATVAGMFEAIKSGFAEVKNVIAALMTGNPVLIAKAFADLGAKSKKAYRKGYSDKLKEELEQDVVDAVGAVNANAAAAETGEEVGDSLGEGVKEGLRRKLKEAALELQKFRAEAQVEQLEERAGELQEGDPERDAALRLAAAKRIEIASMEAQKLLLNEGLLADERTRINEEAANKIAKISSDLYKKLKVEPLNALDGIERLVQGTKEEAIKALKQQGAEQQKQVSDWLARYKAQKEREVELEKQAAAEKAAIRQASEQLAWQGYDLFFTMRQASMQQESQSLEAQKEQDLKTAGDNEAAKQAISEKYAAEQAKLRQRQARMQKTQALLEIAITTAIAVAKAISASPITFGLPWSAFALAQGAMQAAAVAAQPLPQYYVGTEDSKEGLAHVAERGPELVITPSGKLQYVEKPSIMYLPAHSKVKTASETSDILSGSSRVSLQELSNAYSTGAAAAMPRAASAASEWAGFAEAVVDAVAQQQQVHVSVDENGFKLWQKKGAMWSELVNKKYKKK